MPGWDEWYREATRKFAHHGYAALSPNLYFRAGHGTPEDVAAKVRAAGGVADEQVLGDVAGALHYLRALPSSNGKVGVFGTCSGGRQAFLAACRVPGFDAVVDCWGGRVVMAPDELTPKQPVAPIDYTQTCPARCSACLARRTRIPPRPMSRSSSRRSRRTARIISFTCTQSRPRLLLL